MDKKDLKIIFMGTPDFAVATLKALVENDYRVVAVVTQPDKPVGRHGSVLQAPAVKRYALELGIDVLQPERLSEPTFLQTLASYEAHVQVVVAFRLLPESVWAMPPMGTFNVHAALLPKYRGAAPINWAIIGGEKETGVTTFFLDKDMDTGGVIERRTLPIPRDADAAYVHDGLMTLGAELALDTLQKLLDTDGAVPIISQKELPEAKEVFNTDGSLLPRYLAPKLSKEICKINWSQSSDRVHDFIRGLSPVPGAWTVFSGKKVKIFRTAETTRPAVSVPGTLQVEGTQLFVDTANGQLEIIELQQEGKKRLSAAMFLNGWRRE